MKKLSNHQGATLVEILISIVIIISFVTAAANTLLNSQFLASYSKHKIQAMYAAQQILEQERRLNFSDIVTQASTPVTLDTNGTFSATEDDFKGNSIITVTAIDARRKNVQLQINWQEQVLASKITVTDYYSMNISDDPITN